MHTAARVEYDDVCFEYEVAAPVLRHVSFTVPGGRTVAFVVSIDKFNWLDSVLPCADTCSQRLLRPEQSVMCCKLVLLRVKCGSCDVYFLRSPLQRG